MNSKLQRAARARGHFPTDEAAIKLLFLVLSRSEKEWKTPPREEASAKSQFTVIFGERFRPQGRKQKCSTARPYTKFLTVPIAGDAKQFARKISLEPLTPPVESPQSNGMAEAFVRLAIVHPASSWRIVRLPKPESACPILQGLQQT